MTAPEIADRPDRHRYELTVDGKLAAHIDYRVRAGGVIDLVHTEVGKEYEGQGLASKIVKFALDDARSHSRRVIPSCSYVAGWLQKHPEYGDLVARQ